MKANNIHPVFSLILQRSDKEQFLKQQAKVIWLTGLSGAGKTTLGIALESELYKRGFLTQILDGDNMRAGINSNLGFRRRDRMENIRRVAEVAKLFVNCGIITISGFITPRETMRTMARNIIGEESYISVYVNAPLEVCEQRDVKGLYRKARNGLIKNFTGITARFEPPQDYDIEIKTDQYTIEESVNQLLDFVLPLIKYERVS